MISTQTSIIIGLVSIEHDLRGVYAIVDIYISNRQYNIFRKEAFRKEEVRAILRERKKDKASKRE